MQSEKRNTDPLTRMCVPPRSLTKRKKRHTAHRDSGIYVSNCEEAESTRMLPGTGRNPSDPVGKPGISAPGYCPFGSASFFLAKERT